MTGTEPIYEVLFIIIIFVTNPLFFFFAGKIFSILHGCFAVRWVIAVGGMPRGLF